ncbi:MAG: glycosyltransferase family 9 protein [Candidatus Rokubacteria bacterium]|nr:glycosyltransferase family 9 protein [Candidatus Rokubacteria bacterium]
MNLATDVRHLIVRLPNWLGDTVMALPALRALRSGLHGRRITLVGPWAPLLAGQGAADGFVAYPRSARKRLAAVPELRRLEGDTVLLLPNSIESALAAWLWGARWILGYATDGRGRLLSHPLPPPAPRRHQVDEYVALLAPFGISDAEPTPRWILPSNGDERLDALLPSEGVTSRPRIGIHLGAAFGPSKLWPSDRLAALCRELRRRGLVPVLLGTPSEEAIANAIVASAGGDLISLVGKDAPELLPGLLARLDLLVGMDTGVAHLAAAVGVPVVALFGPTDPGLTAPRGPSTCVIWKPPPCSPCFLPECPIEHPCMRAIGVEEVLEAVEARVGARR